MSEEIAAPVAEEAPEQKLVVKVEGHRLTGFEEVEHEHYLPPYHTEETFKIAQERENAAKDGVADESSVEAGASAGTEPVETETDQPAASE